jgi:hypothetical protein
MLVILALERQRQEDSEFKTGLGYRARPCLKKKKNLAREIKYVQI